VLSAAMIREKQQSAPFNIPLTSKPNVAFLRPDSSRSPFNLFFFPDELQPPSTVAQPLVPSILMSRSTNVIAAASGLATGCDVC
jgi:hypothetical protein